jgi:DNA polymerase-3 subunit delta
MTPEAPRKEKALLCAYLFDGADKLKRRDLLKRLMTRVEAQCELSLNMENFDATQVKEPSVVIDACNTLPFASEKRLVIVKNVDKALKAFADALVSYLGAPCSSTVLVLEAEKLAKNSRLVTAIKKLDAKAYIDCAEVKRGDLPSLVQKMAQSKGVEITADAARKLIELAGSSTLALDAEMVKLVAYVSALGRASISRADIAAVVTRSVEHNQWDLVEAFGNRNTAKALELARELRVSGTASDGNPVSLLALCTVRLRDLIKVKSLQARGCSTERAIAEAMGGQRQEWQVRRLIQAAHSRSADELRALCIKAAHIDMKMKSGYNADLLFTEFLLES